MLQKNHIIAQKNFAYYYNPVLYIIKNVHFPDCKRVTKKGEEGEG